jgi:hypothetical protein
LEDENLIELTFKGSGGTGCKYATHSRRFRSTKLYVILCTFTVEHQIFINIFQGKNDVNIQQSIYIHACHKIYERCLSKFKLMEDNATYALIQLILIIISIVRKS